MNKHPKNGIIAKNLDYDLPYILIIGGPYGKEEI